MTLDEERVQSGFKDGNPDDHVFPAPGWRQGSGRISISDNPRRTSWKESNDNASGERAPSPSYRDPEQPQASSSQASPSQSTTSRGIACTVRLVFWIAVGMSWVVWLFALAAASDDKWLENLSSSWNSDEFGVASDRTLDFCDNSSTTWDDFCNLYKAFSALQILATFFCSVAAVVLTVSFFRPNREGWCSVVVLARVGAGLMFIFTFFQLISFLLVVIIEKEELDPEMGYGVGVGDTFAVAVFGWILGTASSVLLCIFATQGGDGPLHKGLPKLRSGV